jgi:hypothetical protein
MTPLTSAAFASGLNTNAPKDSDNSKSDFLIIGENSTRPSASQAVCENFHKHAKTAAANRDSLI